MKDHPHWGPSDGLLHGPTFDEQLKQVEAIQKADDVRSTYREISPEQQFQIASVKEIGQELIDLIDTVPLNRELAVAKTKVEEAVMWAVKGLTV